MSTIDISMAYVADGFQMSLTGTVMGIEKVTLDFSNIGTTAQQFIDYFDLVSPGGAYAITEAGNYLIEIQKLAPFGFWPDSTFKFYGVFDTASAGSSFLGLDFTTLSGLIEQTGNAGALGAGGGLIGDSVTFAYKGIDNSAVPLSTSQAYLLTGLGMLAVVGLCSKAKTTYRLYRKRGMAPREAALNTAFTAVAVPWFLAARAAENIKLGCAMAIDGLRSAVAGHFKGLFGNPDAPVHAGCAQAAE